MVKRLLDQQWPWWIAGAAIVLVFLSTIIEVDIGGSDASRPVGTPADIASLRDRDDVNVLFILIDTLRADRLSAYGYRRDTSPTLRRLAASGVRFEWNLAQSSWTKTSMASLWTGLNPARTGIASFDHVLPDEAMMPAEVFREAGFRTAGVYRNGWVAPSFGFGQGFEVYQKSVARPLPANVIRENPTVSDRSTDEAVVRAAVEFLRVRGRDRWFLYLHLMDLHEYIYDAESARFGSTYSDVYDNSILWTDRTLEILFEYLDDLGLMDKTLIVLGSDHGEAFGEHGVEGHARRVYRETTEVPWLMSFPFRLEQGISVRQRTRNIDIWPTVLELLGLETGQVADGISRVPEILSAAGVGEGIEPEEGLAFAQLNQNWARPGTGDETTVAVVDGPHRFVRIDSDGARIEQLFDRGDPGEHTDHAAERPDEVARLSKLADEYLGQEPVWTIDTRELTELEFGQLRALGYVIE